MASGNIGTWTDHDINDLAMECFHDARAAGWEPSPEVPTILMLVVSELAEAMEGHRRDLMDDKLPHRKMLEVELADAVIRIGHLAHREGLDLGGAVVEKMAFNRERADHKAEARNAASGKRY